MLAHSDVGAYLLEAGLFDRDAIAAGGLKVRDVSGRNRVFVVLAQGKAGYVVKQADPGDHDLLAHEAVVMRQIAAADHRLARSVPTPVFYDARRRILVSELVADAMELSAYHARGRFPSVLARQVGRFLALLHGLRPEVVEEVPDALQTVLPGVPEDPPSLELMLAMSDAGVQLLEVLQGSTELCDRLAQLRDSWRATSVIHGDIRSSNCVAFPPPRGRRRTRIALVDWESAGGGDPHLDLGAVLGEYLHTWLWSIPVLDGGDLGHAPRYARHPLRAMRPAIRAFWLAHVGARERHGATARPSLHRAIEFSAAYLVQVAFVRAQAASTFDPRTGLALQLSLNMLRRPTEAAVQLLGLAAVDGTR